MSTNVNQAGSFIFGGLFVGVWLAILLFETGVDSERWLTWGLIGLLFAGGIYASRIAQGGLRIGLFVGLGVGLGLIITAALLQEIEEALAGVMTFLGGALVGSAMPSPNDDERPVAPADVSPTPAPPASPKRR
jgi:hypothetical protein